MKLINNLIHIDPTNLSKFIEAVFPCKKCYNFYEGNIVFPSFLSIYGEMNSRDQRLDKHLILTLKCMHHYEKEPIEISHLFSPNENEIKKLIIKTLHNKLIRKWNELNDPNRFTEWG